MDQDPMRGRLCKGRWRNAAHLSAGSATSGEDKPRRRARSVPGVCRGPLSCCSKRSLQPRRHLPVHTLHAVHAEKVLSRCAAAHAWLSACCCCCQPCCGPWLRQQTGLLREVDMLRKACSTIVACCDHGKTCTCALCIVRMHCGEILHRLALYAHAQSQAAAFNSFSF